MATDKGDPCFGVSGLARRFAVSAPAMSVADVRDAEARAMVDGAKVLVADGALEAEAEARVGKHGGR